MTVRVLGSPSGVQPSRLHFFGHSIMADGGAGEDQRGFSNLLAAMLRVPFLSHAEGGAALAYHNKGATGDGGFSTLVNAMPNVPQGVNWRGAYNGGSQYLTRDGVLSGGNWYMNAGGTVTGVAPPGGGWLPVTGPNVLGAGQYMPRQEVPVLMYGNNDLGFYNEWNIFKEALIYAFAACSCATIYDDNDPNLVYGGTGGAWPARSLAPTNGTGDCIGTGFENISVGVGGTITINVPGDFPGGTVDAFFICLNPPILTLTSTIDGAAGPTKKFASVLADAVNGQAFPNAANFSGGGMVSPAVMRFTGLAPGPHTIVMTVSSAGANVFFDGWGIEAAPTPAQIFFISLIKMNSYAIYAGASGNSQGLTITDALVDTWNANIKALIAASFPNVNFIDVTNVLNKDPQYFYADGVHPNSRGHALLAAAVHDQMKAVAQATPRANAAAQASPQRVGNYNFYFANSANFVLPASPDATWTAVSDTTLARGPGFMDISVKADPGDVVELCALGTWNNDASYGYVDFLTIIPTTGGALNWVSAGTMWPSGYQGGTNAVGSDQTQAQNGVPGCIANPSVYTSLMPGKIPYVVKANDSRNGTVTFRLYAKKIGAGVAKTILKSPGNPVILMAENKGPMSAVYADVLETPL